MTLPPARAEPSGGYNRLKTGGSYSMKDRITRTLLELHPELAARLIEFLVVLLC